MKKRDKEVIEVLTQLGARFRFKVHQKVIICLPYLIDINEKEGTIINYYSNHGYPYYGVNILGRKYHLFAKDMRPRYLKDV